MDISWQKLGLLYMMYPISIFQKNLHFVSVFHQIHPIEYQIWLIYSISLYNVASVSSYFQTLFEQYTVAPIFGALLQ